MTKENKFGLFGALFCGAFSFLDDEWKLFWISCGVLLAAWTVISLWKQFRAR